MSISLPGLARFGCDLSATVGGIPDFGQAFRSRGSGHKGTREKLGANGCGHRPALAGLLFRSRAGLDFHQSIQELRLDPWPRSLPAAIDDRGIRRHAQSSKSLAERAIRERAFGPQFRMHPPVLRFGNSRKNRLIHPTQRQFTSWALWAADAAVNALLGLRRCRQ